MCNKESNEILLPRLDDAQQSRETCLIPQPETQPPLTQKPHPPANGEGLGYELCLSVLGSRAAPHWQYITCTLPFPRHLLRVVVVRDVLVPDRMERHRRPSGQRVVSHSRETLSPSPISTVIPFAWWREGRQKHPNQGWLHRSQSPPARLE